MTAVLNLIESMTKPLRAAQRTRWEASFTQKCAQPCINRGVHSVGSGGHALSRGPISDAT